MAAAVAHPAPADSPEFQTVNFHPPQEAPLGASVVDAAAPPSSATPTFEAPPTAKPAVKPRMLRAIGGAGIGILTGASIWGCVGFLTGGWEFKYGAILIGRLTGVLVSKGAGVPSKAMGVVAAGASLASLLFGKVLFEVLVHPGFTMSQHIAYHTTVIDFIFFAATAAAGFAVASTSGGIAKLRGFVRRFIPGV
ncbi:MAG: hypothetical protein AAGF12_15565 [Myxococcota bacterium]